MAKITVYITNYNYEKYIAKSIESVLNQTLQNFDLIIIDDGSTDNSRNIIEQYRNHPQIQIVYQQNKGLNVTNNIAMRMANSYYIMRLDADDFLEHNALELMSEQLDKDPDLGLVFPNYYYVDNEGNKIGEEVRHDFNKEVTLYDLPAHGACTMIRLTFLKNLGGYNESFNCQDGYDLWIKFISHYKVSNLSQPLFSYRRHGNNLTTNEERILNTRKKIKQFYLESTKAKTPDTVAILPLRNNYFGKINLPIHPVNGTTLIERKLKELVIAKNVSWIIITCSDTEILDYLKTISINSEKIQVVERPKELARQNIDLNATYNFVLDKLKLKNIHPECIMSVAVEFPFITADAFDDAINTLTIFNADSLIAVRPETRMFYQHVGKGLKPILDQDKFTKLEREALYRGAGGILVSTIKNFYRENKISAGKISHIILDEKSSFQILSDFDYKIYNLLTSIKEPVIL